MRSYHGRDCNCDHCCAGYNAANHEYVKVTKQGPRFNESYDEMQRRARKQADTAEKNAKEKSCQ